MSPGGILTSTTVAEWSSAQVYTIWRRGDVLVTDGPVPDPRKYPLPGATCTVNWVTCTAVTMPLEGRVLCDFGHGQYLDMPLDVWAYPDSGDGRWVQGGVK